MGISMVYMGQMVGFEKIQGNIFLNVMMIWTSTVTLLSGRLGVSEHMNFFFGWEGGEGRKWERKSNGHTYGLKVVIL